MTPAADFRSSIAYACWRRALFSCFALLGSAPLPALAGAPSAHLGYVLPQLITTNPPGGGATTSSEPALNDLATTGSASPALQVAGKFLGGIYNAVYDSQGNFYYTASTPLAADNFVLGVVRAGSGSHEILKTLTSGPAGAGIASLAYDAARNVLAYERPGFTSNATGLVQNSQIEELNLATGQVTVRSVLPGFAYAGGLAYGADSTLYVSEVDGDATNQTLAVILKALAPGATQPTVLMTLLTAGNPATSTFVGLNGYAELAADLARGVIAVHLPPVTAGGTTIGLNTFSEYTIATGNLAQIGSVASTDTIYTMTYAPAPGGSGTSLYFLDLTTQAASAATGTGTGVQSVLLQALPAGGGTVTTARDLVDFSSGLGYVSPYFAVAWYPGAATLPASSVVGARSALPDFDGNGAGDLLWTNVDGSAAIWLMSVSDGFISPTVINSTTVTTPVAQVTFGPYPGWTLTSGDSDFNGDGKSDLVWTNASGAIALWLMNGTSPTATPSFGPYAGWTLVSANSDFNGDGKSDLLWRNTNGAVAIWLMDGANVLSQAVYGPYDGWRVVSSNNDFNGDGKSDLLWQNTSGAVAVWLMNGTTQTSTATFGPYAGWRVLAGNADYNGDGKTDLLWQNSNGQVAVWLMNGATQASSAAFGPFAGWSVLPGNRDFDGDGKSDLLWQNASGAVSTWLMDGLQPGAVATYGPYAGWSLTGAANDYNGDGITDLLWTNVDGTASVWLMDGGTQLNTANYGPFAGWSVLSGRTGP